jgi:hypothetical protein
VSALWKLWKVWQLLYRRPVGIGVPIEIKPNALARVGESATLIRVTMNVFRVAVLLLVFGVVVSFAEETNTLPNTITVDGVTYSNVTWRTVTPITVSIFHETGVASIPLEKLPTDLQQRFGYDPQKAADYRTQQLAAIQAQELLRQKRMAEMLATARQQQLAQAEQAKIQATVQAKEDAQAQLKANQEANANVRMIQVLRVVGFIRSVNEGGYAAQLELTNQATAQTITVCANFDEAGRRCLEDGTKKFLQWKARQDALDQQVAVQGQSLTLYGGGKNSVRVIGPGWGPAGVSPTSAGPPPAVSVFALREENSCYTVKGSHEFTTPEGLKNYSW